VHGLADEEEHDGEEQKVMTNNMLTIINTRKTRSKTKLKTK
jgi:hypothetical protein